MSRNRKINGYAYWKESVNIARRTSSNKGSIIKTSITLRSNGLKVLRYCIDLGE